MNSKSAGKVTFVTAKPSGSDYFIGFCYEFAIVIENKNQSELLADLYEAAKGYLQVARENNLPDELLDKHKLLPADLQDLYASIMNSVNETKESHKVRAPDEYTNALNTGAAQLSVACV